MIVQHIDAPEMCCDEIWEAAYHRFETPEEEITKFTKRLRRFGIESLRRDVRVVELFCGRGNGLTALERLGWNHVEGVDLSLSLLQQYQGDRRLHLADCRDLPLDDASFDVAVVQGGLHHLPNLDIDGDLDACLREASRVLRPGGQFWMVEPWMTPFLKLAHGITDRTLVRRFYAKGDALATMTQREATTYYQWLGRPGTIMAALDRHFRQRRCRIRWGKIEYIGEPKTAKN